MLLTDEQAAVVRDAVVDESNVLLCANYGSGKTTVVLRIVQDVKAGGGQALCLVYNASMKVEMRNAVAQDCRHTVHTVHSAAQYVFDGVCGSNDDGILASLSADVSARGFDLISRTTHIIVDEAQDIKPLFYDFLSRLVRVVTRVRGRRPSLMLVGDALQEVNRWNGSDARFMTMASDLEYGGAGAGLWKRRELTVTFRCPRSVVDANNRLTGLAVTTPNGPGPLPTLRTCDVWDASRRNSGLAQILDWCAQGFSPSDILVLVPSLKSSAPGSVLQTLLTGADIASYQPMKDDQEGGLGAGLLVNKVRFCTFHACKGMEAECVLALCFDRRSAWLEAGYDGAALAPPYHVAMTRCKSRLCLLQGAAGGAVPAVRQLIVDAEVGRYFDTGGTAPDGGGGDCDRAAEKAKKYTVTDFVDGHLCPRSVVTAVISLAAETVGPDDATDEDGVRVQPDCAPSVVPSRAHPDAVEDVSCLNGTVAELVVACALRVPFNAVPPLRSLMSPGAAAALMSQDLAFERRADMRLEYATAKEETGLMDLKTATLAALVHKYKADKYTTLMSQIRGGPWWTPAHRESVLYVLDGVLRRLTGAGAGGAGGWSTEVPCETTVCGMPLVGRADFVAPGLLLETKYTAEMTSAHLLQMVIYAHALGVPAGTRCCLVNLKTGEYTHIVFEGAAVERCLSLLRLKGAQVERLADAAFLAAYGRSAAAGSP